MKTILVITVMITLSLNLSAKLGSKTSAENIIAIYDKQITDYEKQKSRLESDLNKGIVDYQATIVAIHKVDSMIDLLSTRKNNFILNLKPEDLEKESGVKTKNEEEVSLADRQKKQIGKTGQISENRMYNTLNVNRQVMLDDYRQKALDQRINNGSCGSSSTRNGILYYTASNRSYYGNAYSYPAAEIIITAIDANGKKLAGIPEKRATLYLQDHPTVYSLSDGRYHGEIWINGQKVWQKDFDVIIGEKSANYRGEDFEFKLGFDVSKF